MAITKIASGDSLSVTDPIGGLGIHMIRQLTDDLRYEARAGHNVLSLIKHLPVP